MTLNKKRLISLLALVSVLLLILFLVFRNPLKNLETADVMAIKVGSGSTGRVIEITDSETIEYLIDNLASISTRFESFQLGGKTGFAYSITVYRENNEILTKCTLDNTTGTHVTVNGVEFQTIHGTAIDIKYLEQLF